MRKRNGFFALMLILLTLVAAQHTVVKAATGPSITIIRRQAVAGANQTQQQTVPQPGIGYVIDAVTVTPRPGHTLKLSQPASFTWAVATGEKQRHFQLVTDRNGQAQIAGATNLPKGYYRIAPTANPKAALFVTLPYRSGNQVRDDLVIEPKAGLAGAAKVTPKTAAKGKLMQTSGTTVRMPYWLLALGLIGAVVLGLVVASGYDHWRQTRREVRA